MGDIVELKNKKGALTKEVYHPLMNVAHPSVEDLKKRCDDESIALLDAACRLASYRSQCKEQVRVAYDNYADEPAAAADCKVIEMLCNE